MTGHVEKNERKMMSTFRFIRQLILFDCVEQFLMTIGIFCALTSAMCLPVMYVIYGKLTKALVEFGSPTEKEGLNITICQNQSTHICNNEWITIEMNDSTRNTNLEFENYVFIYRMVITATVQMTLYYIMLVSLNTSKERQVHRIRSQLFQSILNQDISWFDTKEGEEFPIWAIQNTNNLEAALGDKIGVVIQFLATFTFNIITCLVTGWQLTLVLLAASLVSFLSLITVKLLQKKLMAAKRDTNVAATAIALEVIGTMRTVQAFGGQPNEVERFDRRLKNSINIGVKYGLLTAGGSAFNSFIHLANNGLAFWFSVKLMYDSSQIYYDKDYSVATVVTVLLCNRSAFLYLTECLPYFEIFTQATVSAKIILGIINRKPEIDSNSSEGLTPKKVAANLELNSVDFSYPTRPEIKVLDNFCLHIRDGETMALVGESGSGKTSVIQLILRFYIPQKGTITLGGHDIKELNIGWLRTNISVVSQEPVLFSTTIAENIRYGLKSATQEDIENASMAANAHDFISRFPNKYDTLVGEGGAQLSGGQKQRIAIARALIRNSKILLLDEATSALDSTTETRFLRLLLKAKKNQTVLVVAHRWSTIVNADRIAVMSNGRIAELGTHNELIAHGGLYYAMFNKQQELSTSGLSRESDALNEECYQDLPHGLPDEPIPNNEVKRNNENEINDSPPSSLGQLMSLCRQEMCLLVLGYLGACGVGLSVPSYALLFGRMLKIFTLDDTELILKTCAFYTLMFVVLAIGTAICSFLQISLMTYSAELLARRIRKRVFTTILFQDLNFFDNPSNSIGSLSNILNTDALNLQDAAGSKMGTALQHTAGLFFGYIFILMLNWKMGLVFLCATTVMFIPFYIQYNMGMKRSTLQSKITDNSNRVAIEAATNIRTVVGLHSQSTFHENYIQKMTELHKKVLVTIHILGFTSAFGLSASMLFLGALYTYLGLLVLNKEVDVKDAITITSLIWYSTIFIGQIFLAIPHINKGIVSAKRISKILKYQPKIEEIQNSGTHPVMVDSRPPNLEFHSISFKYAFRPHAPVLQDINLKIESGQALALVGTTGCGKTTCLNLLERFYNPTKGYVTFDNMDITTLNVQWLRSQMGLVSQEPVLFNRSVAGNIAYGDNTRQVPMDEIIEAATKANIHHFIITLPQGYDTVVGAKGIKLSGGQKQRIAIARALVRDPKILLLDEPTSAMDVENEKVVQEALDRAQKGRTCIIMAHRLSTIRAADQIAVIHQGSVVEKGTHEELMEMKGHYFRFYQTPQLQKI